MCKAAPCPRVSEACVSVVRTHQGAELGAQEAARTLHLCDGHRVAPVVRVQRRREKGACTDANHRKRRSGDPNKQTLST